MWKKWHVLNLDMGPPEFLPFSLSYSAGHWQLKENTRDSKVCWCLEWIGAPFCLCSSQTSEEDELCAIWPPVLRLQTRRGSVPNMWILTKDIRMHMYIRFLMFLLFMKKSWLHHTVIPANVVEITLRKCGKKFLQDSVFYNVFQNILYNTFEVRKKVAVLWPFLTLSSFQFLWNLFRCFSLHWTYFLFSFVCVFCL